MSNQQLSRQTKECLGCRDTFLTYRNYDYCSHCAVNGQRYHLNSNCSECDGSGRLQFRGQKPRSCKLCTLKASEKQFWVQVDQSAQSLITNCLQQVLPLQPHTLQLTHDADYRQLLTQELPQYYRETNYTESDLVPLAQILTREYLTLVQAALSQLITNYYDQT